MGGGEFLEALYITELPHHFFPSAERLVGVFNSIIEPSPTWLALQISNHFHRRNIRSEPVRHDFLWPTVTFHRALQTLNAALRSPRLKTEHDPQTKDTHVEGLTIVC